MGSAALAQAPVSTLAPSLNAPIGNGFVFTAVGDLVYLRPMLATIDARSPELVRLLRNADVTFGNFEATAFDLHDFGGSPQAESGGTWLIADPRVPGDLRDMGFDIVSLANNHATDWGVEGLAETGRRLDAEGIVHAGSGRSLEAARLPRYLDTARGRVALVSAASTFTPMSRAADALGEIPARAGINALRIQQIAHVTKAQLKTLKEIQATTGTSSPESTADVLGTLFREGLTDNGRMTFSYEVNKADADAILMAVRQAKQNGNFVVFSLHNHEPANDVDTPADFAIAFARKAIDSGADVYVGHGPHILRGIEIYKGKPIFYSLGNFAMMNTSLDVIPADMYEQYRASPGSVTVPEVLAVRAQATFSDPRQYRSVIAVSRFAEGRVAEIRLYPIVLGSNGSPAARGVPAMASSEEGREILQKLRTLSKPFGTDIRIERGVGIITIGAER